MENLFDNYQNISEIVERLNILKQNITVPQDIREDLIPAYQICRVLDQYLPTYFRGKTKSLTTIEINEHIDQTLIKFKQEVLKELLPKKGQFKQKTKSKKTKFKNIFEFAGSENLYLSNIYTRFISENLGHKFEDIASISPKVFIPDKVLKIKIKGIDLIIWDQNIIKYAQIKTKKDTLTGSQKDRSVSELKIHVNSIFAAALDMGNAWTISSSVAQKYNIQLLAGQEFWSLIDLDYDLILHKIAKVINELDKELYT